MKTEKISNGNIENLEAIQKIINVEEGKIITLNQTLNRVLNFYRRYVPYN